MQRGFRSKRRKAATRAAFQSLTVAAAIPDKALHGPVSSLCLADAWLFANLVHHEPVRLRSVALARNYERIGLGRRVGSAALRRSGRMAATAPPVEKRNETENTANDADNRFLRQSDKDFHAPIIPHCPETLPSRRTAARPLRGFGAQGFRITSSPDRRPLGSAEREDWTARATDRTAAIRSTRGTLHQSGTHRLPGRCSTCSGRP